MPPQPPPLNIVAFAVALAGLVFDPRIAEFVGTYAVIFLGAVLGGALSASRRGSASRTATLVYMALVILLALLVTVPLAEALAPHIPVVRLEPRVLFAPVAAVVAGIGHDWPKVLLWFFKRWQKPSNPPGGPTP